MTEDYKKRMQGQKFVKTDQGEQQGTTFLKPDLFLPESATREPSIGNLVGLGEKQK